MSRKIEFGKNLRIYAGYLKNHKGLAAGLILAVLISEIASLFEKLAFKLVVDSGNNWVADVITKASFVSSLTMALTIFVVVIIVRVFGRWAFVSCINRLDTALIVDLKESLFNHVLGLSYHFHTSHRTGTLISKITRGGRAMEKMTDVLAFNVATMVVQLIVSVSSIIYFSIEPAIVILIVFVLFVSHSLVLQKYQQRANISAIAAEDYEKGQISDIFTNIDSIKYFGKEHKVIQRFKKMIKTTGSKMLHYWDYHRLSDAGHALILGVGTIALLYFPLRGFLDGEITIGTVVFMYTIFGGIVHDMYGFVHGIRNFYDVMADFQSIFSYFKIENEVKDLPGAKKLTIREGSVEFRDVTFAYHGAPLLKNFNFTIKPGEKVALVGPSGSGKSTLIKLLYRLYDVNHGGIFVDGKNILDFKQQSLREELSVVPQECVLFDDTLFNNVRFSRPSASPAIVARALRFSQLDKVVATLPNRERTIVGERGVRLSGGEKQRVSIARAILADKKILVLDEATSALDSQTENDIQKDLKRLMKGRTAIIIAHRLSTIMQADKIVVLNKGKIVQMGRHSQLIKQKGMYKTLWNLQKGGYIR